MNYAELPPLAFLPALEAAGRLGSFKAAAEELHVTPSAISQQVKAIEEALGKAIFERRGRTVVMTPDGERYLRDVRQSLRELVNAGRRLRGGHEARSILRLDTVPFVAHEFLLPRLCALGARFPELTLQLDTSMRVIDFQYSEIDAAIRLGGGPWLGLTTRPFGTMNLALVCAPALAERIHCLKDLADHTLIEIRSMQERGLVNMLKGEGIAIDPARVHSFETYFETVRAAEHGLGVAVGIFPLTTHWVLEGRLAVPFPVRSLLPGYVALVHRPSDTRFPFDELTQWLEQEYNALPALPEGRILPS